MLTEGVKSDGSVKTLAVTDDGKLKVDASVSVDAITIGDIEIKNDVGNPMPVASGLAIPEHDYIALTYTGADLTGVVYKTGGAGGTTVATLTLAYSGGKLASVTKS